ncbi:MAG TPA: GntR family transcriptional regulator [Devosiaceae bacterium]|jgi:DNA-binding GntR family transcriptional regulator
MSSDRRSKKVSLSTRIREVLSARILNGELQPGERLVEMRLAEEFDTSQAPVREALRELEMAGMIESSRNRGTRVKVTSLKELGEIYDVRSELEAFAGAAAAEVMATRIPQLQAQVEAMLEAARQSDLTGFGEANALFHRTIVEAADNATLLDIWQRLDVKSRTMVNMIRSSSDLAATARAHMKIIAAFERGNIAEIRRELRGHVIKFKPQNLAGPPSSRTAPDGED